MGPEFVPIATRITVQDGVYRQLRHALMIGQFDPGQALTISSLAEQFGTSHMPVREALRRLAAENALEIASNGSARVPAVSATRLDDLCQARVALEGLAAELAQPRLQGDAIEALEAIVGQHEALGRSGQIYPMLAKNQQFHFMLYAASGSEVLLQLIETLWLRFGCYMRMLTRHIEPLMKARRDDMFAENHHKAIAALRRKDAGAVKQAIVDDIKATRDLLYELCPEVQV
jgi:DNA-binding GntR family transcriptional regulator